MDRQVFLPTLLGDNRTGRQLIHKTCTHTKGRARSGVKSGQLTQGGRTVARIPSQSSAYTEKLSRIILHSGEIHGTCSIQRMLTKVIKSQYGENSHMRQKIKLGLKEWLDAFRLIPFQLELNIFISAPGRWWLPLFQMNQALQSMHMSEYIR